MFIVKYEFIVLGLTRDAFHFLYQDPENPIFITCFLMDLFAYFLIFLSWISSILLTHSEPIQKGNTWILFHCLGWKYAKLYLGKLFA